MDRMKLVNAIVSKFRDVNPVAQEALLVEALRFISSDSNLLAFAVEIGIDANSLWNRPS